MAGFHQSWTRHIDIPKGETGVWITGEPRTATGQSFDLFICIVHMERAFHLELPHIFCWSCVRVVGSRYTRGREGGMVFGILKILIPRQLF